jgi:hypothetical protein
VVASQSAEVGKIARSQENGSEKSGDFLSGFIEGCHWNIAMSHQALLALD